MYSSSARVLQLSLQCDIVFITKKSRDKGKKKKTLPACTALFSTAAYVWLKEASRAEQTRLNLIVFPSFPIFFSLWHNLRTSTTKQPIYSDRTQKYQRTTDYQLTTSPLTTSRWMWVTHKKSWEAREHEHVSEMNGACALELSEILDEHKHKSKIKTIITFLKCDRICGKRVMMMLTGPLKRVKPSEHVRTHARTRAQNYLEWLSECTESSN